MYPNPSQNGQWSPNGPPPTSQATGQWSPQPPNGQYAPRQNQVSCTCNSDLHCCTPRIVTISTVAQSCASISNLNPNIPLPTPHFAHPSPQPFAQWAPPSIPRCRQTMLTWTHHSRCRPSRRPFRKVARRCRRCNRSTPISTARCLHLRRCTSRRTHSNRKCPTLPLSLHLASERR